MNKFNNIFFTIIFSSLLSSICYQFVSGAKNIQTDIVSLETLKADLNELSNLASTKNKVVKKEPAKEIPKESIKPTIIDVYLTRCGPCKRMAPIFDALERELGSKYTFRKVNADESNEVDLYDIGSVPTFVFLKNNQMVHKIAGSMTQDKLRAEIIHWLGT